MPETPFLVEPSPLERELTALNVHREAFAQSLVIQRSLPASGERQKTIELEEKSLRQIEARISEINDTLKVATTPAA